MNAAVDRALFAKPPPWLLQPAATRISSNGHEFRPMCDSLLPIEPSLSMGQIMHHWREDGYVFLRGFIPRNLVLGVMAHYRALQDAQGDGTAGAGYGTRGHPAHSLVRSAQFEQLCAFQGFQDVASQVLGGETMMLKRRIVRHYRSERPTASRAHRDWSYIDKGADALVTFWVPFVSSGLHSGALVYLDQSRRLEAADIPAAIKRRSDRPDCDKVFSSDLQGLADVTGQPWRYAQLEPGDVFLHDALVVHASLDCQPGAERISTDIRMMRKADRADPRWNTDWAADDGY